MYKSIAVYLILAIFVIGIVQAVPAEAAFVASSSSAMSKIDRQADMDLITHALEMKAVSSRLSQLGFTKEEINTRLASLSDQQVHLLAQKIDKIRPAGDGLAVLGALIVIVFLVVVILWLTHHKVMVR
ncbi:MAG: PA2779 family protein [Actinomycetota bacterium]|nr:PA2779 family protein [Actinomycetota bacterium]